MNREELTGKSREELVEIAEKLNIKVHHKALPETIINQIVQQPEAYQADAMQHVSQQKPEAPKLHSADEVRTAIKKFLDKDGYQANFTESTWHFKYKDREDSGHLSSDMRIIVMKAENVSRGALQPKMMKFDGDTILAG